jgi:hypothetical protein
LYAEALRRAGQHERAQLMDGFGAAFSGSDEAAAVPTVRRLGITPDAAGFTPLEIADVREVTAERMPRLHGLLLPALEAMGAPRVRIFLDPLGGVEAFKFGAESVVLGAGALARFGAAELMYLCAMALALGEHGADLRMPSRSVSGLEAAASLAFQAVPSSLAAGRVLALLDDSVRGQDPMQVNIRDVLRNNRAYQGVAYAALVGVAGV